MKVVLSQGYGRQVDRRSQKILEWKEDLDHLERQFTVEQPGTCDGYDLQQMKRDERVMSECQI